MAKRPRDAAMSMELKEGTGGIIAMCPCDGFLEVYKVDRTFKVLTPEGVDPSGTNVDAPWVASPVNDVGSRNPIIARLMLQSKQFLSTAPFSREVDTQKVMKQLHSCKEALIACEKISNRVCSRIARIMGEVESRGGVETDDLGRNFNPFPHVPDLEHDCGAFLVYTKRVIGLICELPKLFADLDRDDKNFDYLATRLNSAFGEDAPISKFVSGNAHYVRRLIELRNFHEHPTDAKITLIENFRLMPDGKAIKVPMWYVNGDEPRPIKEEMESIVPNLLEIAESMLIALVMETINRGYPFIISALTEPEINPDNPIRYRLVLDTSRLVFNK